MVAKRYSAEEKQQALAALIANGHNKLRTSQQTGIPRTTLLTWEMELGVAPPDRVNEYTERWLAATEMCISRMEELVPVSEDLKAVSDAARTAHNAYLDGRDGRRGVAAANVTNNVTNNVVTTDALIASVIRAQLHNMADDAPTIAG